MIREAGAAPIEDPTSGPFAVRTSPERAFLLAPLPNGGEGFPREILDRHHRNRVLRGAVTSLADCGYTDTSVERLIAAAGVSRYTFYAHFPDKEACFLAAYDRAVDWLEQEVTTAVLGAAGWPEKVRAATGSALTVLGSDPGLARLLAAEILCLGAAGQARHRALVEQLIPLLCLGRAGDRALPGSTPQLELALVSGAISAVAREASAGPAGGLAGLAPDLTEFLLVPYLGHVKARRVARRAPAPPGR